MDIAAATQLALHNKRLLQTMHHKPCKTPGCPNRAIIDDDYCPEHIRLTEMAKSAAVKRWEGTVAAYGCVVSRESAVQLHHPKGRTYKHNKVLIGPWFILPLAHRYHELKSDNPFNVTHWPKRFEIEFGTQKRLFLEMVGDLAEDGKKIPFGTDVIDAIADSPCWAYEAA